MLLAFDRLFDKAAAKLQIACGLDEKQEAKRLFAERFSAMLGAAEGIIVSEIPEEAMQAMESAVEELSSAQVVGYLATLPLLHQTQDMLRTIAHRAAQQRLLEHLISQTDDTYGGN